MMVVHTGRLMSVAGSSKSELLPLGGSAAAE